MLANDQIKSIARSIFRAADERLHRDDDRYDTQQLWDAVRHACHAIEAVSQLEEVDLSGSDRRRRVRFIVAELEEAVEAARRARVVIDFASRDEETH
jgi:hypothetical protein